MTRSAPRSLVGPCLLQTLKRTLRSLAPQLSTQQPFPLPASLSLATLYGICVLSAVLPFYS